MARSKGGGRSRFPPFYWDGKVARYRLLGGLFLSDKKAQKHLDQLVGSNPQLDSIARSRTKKGKEWYKPYSKIPKGAQIGYGKCQCCNIKNPLGEVTFKEFLKNLLENFDLSDLQDEY